LRTVQQPATTPPMPCWRSSPQRARGAPPQCGKQKVHDLSSRIKQVKQSPRPMVNIKQAIVVLRYQGIQAEPHQSDACVAQELENSSTLTSYIDIDTYPTSFRPPLRILFIFAEFPLCRCISIAEVILWRVLINPNHSFLALSRYPSLSIFLFVSPSLVAGSHQAEQESRKSLLTNIAYTESFLWVSP
jgi:hypothetical protein